MVLFSIRATKVHNCYTPILNLGEANCCSNIKSNKSLRVLCLISQSKFVKQKLEYIFINFPLGWPKQRFCRFRFRFTWLGLYAQTVRWNVCREVQDRRCEAHEQIVGWKLFQCQNEKVVEAKRWRQQTIFYHVHFGSNLQDIRLNHEL